MDLITIVVPVYKVEKYLKKCVDSLLCQTYKNIEIILVDDGSPDTCPQLCDEYAQKNSNVVTYHKPNGGLSDARNYGVQKASGDWIVFVDSDDYVESSYVEDLWNLRQRFNADLAITRIVRENEDGSGKSIQGDFEAFCVDQKQAFLEVYTAKKVGWAAYGKLFQKQNLLKHPFPNGFYEDFACMYLLIEECETIAIGNFESNYHYITHTGSILKSNLDARHWRVFELCDDIKSYIDGKYPDLSLIAVNIYRACVTQMLNLQNINKSTYNEVFKRYRPLFRKYLFRVLCSKDFSFQQKYYMFIHCLTPSIYRLQKKLVDIRHHS